MLEYVYSAFVDRKNTTFTFTTRTRMDLGVFPIECNCSAKSFKFFTGQMFAMIKVHIADLKAGVNASRQQLMKELQVQTLSGFDFV